jgi:hypothetical protein
VKTRRQAKVAFEQRAGSAEEVEHFITGHWFKS